MAVASLPARAARSVPWRQICRRLAQSAARGLHPAKPVLRNLASMPLTVAGWGCLAAAAFALNTIVGLAACAPILMILEHQIADED
jgi:hypothetical protein